MRVSLASSRVWTKTLGLVRRYVIISLGISWPFRAFGDL